MVAERFLLGDCIGSGGSARVYSALDVEEERAVAVKLITDGSNSVRAHLAERLQREAEVMRRVAHPNVLEVYEIGSHDGYPYLATALANDTVIAHVERHAVLPRQVLSWMVQVCSALTGAHENGVIHRDVKPHNLLLGDDGTLFLADFGIALIYDRTRLTSSGCALGSMAFMPPEQRLDAAGVDERADIYALGSTVYHLFTGRNPSDLYLCEQDSPRLRSLPPLLRRAIHRSTRLHPEDRYPTARRMAAALMAAQGEVLDLPPIAHHEDVAEATTIAADALRTSLTWLGEEFLPIDTLAEAPRVAPPPAPDASPRPPVPANEEDRLRALLATAMLDTSLEERFDRYTRMAQRLFEVPMALVSLVDRDRQWFKSRAGIDGTETPREHAFCAHAINEPGSMLVVEDAMDDPRFRVNPLVTGDPEIRFYAGMPVLGKDDLPVGTLCILDRRPRSLNPADRAMLGEIASMVQEELMLLERSSIDRVTGLSDRDGFVMQARRLLAFDRRVGARSTLVHIELDLPTELVGDALLHAFAQELLAVFGSQGAVARTGPSAFCVLGPEGLDVDHQVNRLRERTRGRVSTRVRLRYASLVVEPDNANLAGCLERVDADANDAMAPPTRRAL